jgi:hypothetical protein
MSRPLPDGLLERYLAGELTGEALARVEKALAESSEERARVDALRADAAAFLIKHPPGPIAARLEPPRRSWFQWLVPALAAVAALVVAVVFLRPVEDDVTTKGAMAFTAFRLSSDGAVQELTPNAKVKAGDRVRFSVKVPSDGFLAVVSRDGAGNASVYFPSSSTVSARHGATALLPDAIELDGVLGPERVWAIFSARSFEVSQAIEQLKGGSVPKRDGWLVVSVDWVKE